MGFWRFDDNVSPVAFSTILIAVLSTHHNSGCSCPYGLLYSTSTDALFTRTRILCGYGGKSRHGPGRYRGRKEGVLQYLENEGEAIELAINCARLMNADGMVNVQTRHNAEGKTTIAGN